MASLPERAYTCKLPPRKDTSFFRPAMPDWAKIDIVGQTILLAELTPHFGSFQNTCRALKLQSNEVKSFFLTYLQYQQDCNEGNLIAEQWGRDQAVLPAEGRDIPQQRPLLVTPSMIAPACDFLNTLGYYDCIEAVQSWVRRVIIWPPHIDVSGTDLSRLDQTDITFPQSRGERQLSRYKSFLGNDNRAVVGLYGAWKPRENGTPVARVSYIDVPPDSVAYGPGGFRNLAVAGRYYICWPTKSLFHHEYNDLVLATNIPGTRYAESAQSELLDHDDFNGDGGPLMLHMESTVNPKDIFGSDLGTAHLLGQQNTRPPFLAQTAPQGPVRSMENPQLLQAWDSWPGEIFQFRLPNNYTITGPQGHIVTFDPPDHERYDESGAPYGLGGTYYIVPPPKTNIPTTFKKEELPAHVALRVKTTQRLVIIRNGYVMPYFIDTGVHEWSTREGMLDLYGPHGCYNVFAGEARCSIFPGTVENSLAQKSHHNYELNNVRVDGLEGEYAGYTRSAAPSPEPVAEDMMTQPLQGGLLYYESNGTQQIEQDMEGFEQHLRSISNLGISGAQRELRARQSYAQEARVEEVVDTYIPEGTTIGQGVSSGRPRRKRRSNDQLDPSEAFTKPEPDAEVDDLADWGLIAPTPSRRKRKRSEEDEEFTPNKPAKSKARKPASSQKTSTPRKSQLKATKGTKGTRTTRAAPTRKPIGPLLRAIQADQRSGNMSLSLSSLPKDSDGQATASARKQNGRGPASKMTLRVKASKSSVETKDQPVHDPDETEDEEQQ